MTEKRNGPLYRRLLQIRHSSISDDKVDIIYNIQHLFGWYLMLDAVYGSRQNPSASWQYTVFESLIYNCMHALVSGPNFWQWQRSGGGEWP